MFIGGMITKHPAAALGKALLIWLCVAPRAFPACEPCDDYSAGATWGTLNAAALSEASGIAASRLNPGVLWTHNDGTRRKIFALGTNGVLLATFDLNEAVEDLEDIAVGPGPQPGVSYLYVGDIGASASPTQTRREIRILRIPEPTVRLDWAADPPSANFATVESFALQYPDGAYDAEALLVDPLSGDVCVATKQAAVCRVYAAQLPNTAPPTPLNLSLLRSIGFGDVSGGDISPDGTRILLRREELAVTWARCDGEPLGVALGRGGRNVPVIGPPLEPNGEGIAFLADSSGYVTISEGTGPSVYFFASSCPMPPGFLAGLTNRSTYVGTTVEFNATVVGYPTPTCQWRFNGQPLGVSGTRLTLPAVTLAQAGLYEVVASNASGSALSSALLEVRPKPNLRITEVQSSTAPSPGVPTADWWELTSFEPDPVSLQGWRFNDNAGGLTDPFTFATAFSIRPRESIIFVEGITPAAFRTWWGADQLPANLQVITYIGSGLSFSANGDGIRLWSQTATTAADTVAQVDFGPATHGVTFNYNPVNSLFGQLSVLGVNGVFKAALSADIGSPGRILGPPPSPSLQAESQGQTVILRFEAAAGYRYQLQSRAALATGAWTNDGDPLLPNVSGPVSLQRVRDVSLRFYRLLVD